MAIQSQQTTSDHIRPLANLVSNFLMQVIGLTGHAERFGKQVICLSNAVMPGMSGVCH